MLKQTLRDKYYKKCLVNVNAYLEDDSIQKIIEICHLSPDENDWKIWKDGLNNFLTLKTKKKTFTTLKNNQESIDDLYFKKHPYEIYKLSKYILIANIDDDYHCLFFGNDDRLRYSIYSNGQWLKNKSPLTCHINTLIIASNTLSVDDFIVLNYKMKFNENKMSEKGFAIKLPISDFAKKEFNKNNKKGFEEIFNERSLF